MGTSAREMLSKLISENPAILAELLAEVSGSTQGTPAVEDTIFEGSSEKAPLMSKSGQSFKYEAKLHTDGSEYTALVVAYLPPEVASKEISVQLMVGGERAHARARRAS